MVNKMETKQMLKKKQKCVKYLQAPSSIQHSTLMPLALFKKFKNPKAPKQQKKPDKINQLQMKPLPQQYKQIHLRTVQTPLLVKKKKKKTLYLLNCLKKSWSSTISYLLQNNKNLTKILNCKDKLLIENHLSL